MQSLLLIRPAPDKRSLRRSLRGKPPSAVIGGEESGTRVYPVRLPPSEDWGARLTRRAWRRIAGLAQDPGIQFALAPDMDRKAIATGLYARGIVLLTEEGVRQYLTLAAMERLFGLLGRETVAEITASVEDADSRWGAMWVSFLSGWVRCITVSGRGERLERMQRETLARDGTVLAVGRGSPADIRILLGGSTVPGDQRLLIDGRPDGGYIPGSVYSGWPAVPGPDMRDMLTLWERTLAGVYHVMGHRFFSACAPPRDSLRGGDMGGLFAKAGIPVKGFLTDDTVMTFDRMRYRYFEEWRALAESRGMKTT